MTDPALIARLVPQAGAMVLLDGIDAWDGQSIICRATSHLSADNPLRHAGRLGAVAAIEYGLQAAAVHGALTAGGAPPRGGYLASLRDVAFGVERLDDVALGRLSVCARLERREEHGVIYAFIIGAEDGRVLVSGRGVIALQGAV